MYSAEEITQMIHDHLQEGLLESFPLLSLTTLGKPRPLFNLSQKQSHWLVPFLLKSKVRGLAIVDTRGVIHSHGVLSPNQRDESLLMDQGFLDAIPLHFLEEILQNYPGYSFGTPILSFDENPRKWAWLLQLFAENQESKNIFIGPQGWYEQKPHSDRE